LWGRILHAGIVISYSIIWYCFILMATLCDFIFFGVMMIDFVWCIFM